MRPATLRETVTVEHLHDLGKLLFGFVIFWAYIAFSQYFLIWYANFPEETRWYVIRRGGDWNTLSWALVFGHFVVPFFLLLPRATKRSGFWLGFVASWVLVFHYADLYWLIMPALQPEGPDAAAGSMPRCCWRWPSFAARSSPVPAGRVRWFRSATPAWRNRSRSATPEERFP